MFLLSRRNDWLLQQLGNRTLRYKLGEEHFGSPMSKRKLSHSPVEFRGKPAGFYFMAERVR
jgi:hypothetical protein